VSFMVFSFDRMRGGASMRRWKNWALSVAGASLPTGYGLVVPGRASSRASSAPTGSRLYARLRHGSDIMGL